MTHEKAMGNDDGAAADPSALTTEQMIREAQHLKVLFLSLLESVERTMTARLDAMDKAVVILQDISNRSPSINEVFLQHEERFKSIAQQFVALDLRAEQSAAQAKEAIGTAMQATEKANAKSETTFSKQMDQLIALGSANNKAMDERVNDLKERLALMDGRERGLASGREPLHALWMILAGAVVAVIVGIVAAKVGA